MQISRRKLDERIWYWPTTGEAKAEHLVLIVNESSRGHDILGGSSSEGAILLNDDEDDVIELAVMIEEEIVPLYYQGNWARFLIDLLCVLQNAQEDGTGDLMDDIRYFLQTLSNEGIVQVAWI